MPYLEGGELFKKIRQKGVFKEKDAVPIIRSFLSALSYLHENNIVHRDLKPENLMLAKKDDVMDIKIVDFGLSTKLSEASE